MQTIKKTIAQSLLKDLTVIAIRPAYVQLIKNCDSKKTGDHATAAALAQIIHWVDWAENQKNRDSDSFWKIDLEFRKELGLTKKQFERVKLVLKKIPGIEVTLEPQIPPKTRYQIDTPVFIAALKQAEQQIEKTKPKPAPVQTASAPLRATPATVYAPQAPTSEQTVAVEQNNAPIPTEPTPTTALIIPNMPQKGQIEPPQKGLHNTKKTDKDYLLTTTEPQPIIDTKNVVVDLVTFTPKLKDFDPTEQPAAIKLLSTIPETKIESVLTTFALMLSTRTISNKIGYLRSLVTAVKQGTYTPTNPIKPTHQQLPTAELIAKQKKQKKEEAERNKVTNEQWKKMMFNQYGVVMAI